MMRAGKKARKETERRGDPWRREEGEKLREILGGGRKINRPAKYMGKREEREKDRQRELSAVDWKIWEREEEKKEKKKRGGGFE